MTTQDRLNLDQDPFEDRTDSSGGDDGFVDADLDMGGVELGADGAIEVDFESAKGFELVPGGYYVAKCTAITPGKSSSGYPKWDWRWQIIEGEHAKRIIFDTLAFHPNSMGRTKTVLRNLGVNTAGKRKLSPSEVLNTVARIRVDIQNSTQIDPDTQEPYPPRNRIKSFKKIAQSELE